jgi:hypothetical protein
MRSAISSNSSSRISKYLPMMRTETANAIISELNKEIAQESLLLLPLIECGRIGVEAAEVIAPFLVYQHLCEALPVIKPGEIDFTSIRDRRSQRQGCKPGSTNRISKSEEFTRGNPPMPGKLIF